MSDNEDRLQHLSRLALWTSTRLWLGAVLRRTFLLLPLPLAYAVLALTLIKVLRLSLEVQRLLLLFGLIPAAVLVGGALAAGLRRQAWYSGAVALDRSHGLSDRISSALAFRRLPQGQRTIMMKLAMDEAARVNARRLSPRRAAPLRIPAEAGLALGLAGALWGLSLLEVRAETRVTPVLRLPAAELLTGDDAELFRDRLAEVERHSRDPEVLDSTARFNQIVEDLARKPMERDEAFRRIAALEARLVEGAMTKPEALEEGLKRLAEELDRSELSKPAAQAIRKESLPDAAEALQKLAKRLGSGQKDAPTASQLDQLRKALERASTRSAQGLEEIEKRRRKLRKERERLLNKKKSQKGQLAPSEQQSLSDLDRRLERLERERQRAASAAKQLSALDRQLAEAAQNLLRDLGMGARDLEQAAQDIHRMSGQKMTQADKRQLLEQLRQLREILRQQGQGGQKLRRQLQRFSQRARGQSGEKATGKPGRQMKLGPGSLVVGPDVQGAPLPGFGRRQSGDRGSGGDRAGGPEQGGGKEWGTGPGPDLRGKETPLPGTTQDLTAVAKDTGEGTASSEVIQGAAERGFVGRGYRQVYTDYRSVAEEVIERDEIPPGYRFYVQRYFELIRPRQ